MKKILIIILTLMSLSLISQPLKMTNYNKMIDLKDSRYVIVYMDNFSKSKGIISSLLFLDSMSGKSEKLDLPKDSRIQSIEQIHIKDLSINKVLIYAATFDLDGKNGIDWSDPNQIYVCSPSGKDLIQITENNYFVQSWTINRKTGTLIIAGYNDSNNNGKLDKDDKSKILLVELETMALRKTI